MPVAWSMVSFASAIIVVAFSTRNPRSSWRRSSSMARRGRRRRSGLRAEILSSSTTPRRVENRSSDDDPETTTVAITPDELHMLATDTLRYRKRGSKNIIKAWSHWRTAATDAIRRDLSNRLLLLEKKTTSIIENDVVETVEERDGNANNFETLHYKLGVAADTGLNFDGVLFNNAIARCGYAVNFLFSRATNLADLLIDSWNNGETRKDNKNNNNNDDSICSSGLIMKMLWNDDDDESNTLSNVNNGRYSVISLGGGPGFDYVGVALASSFVSYCNTALHNNNDEYEQQRQQQTHNSLRKIDATVFDYEVGWQNIVHALSDSTNHILHHSSNHLSCAWGGRCDITQSIHEPINNSCRELINSKNKDGATATSAPKLYVCQYCIAENVVSLRASNFIFFQQIFDSASEGTMFIFTEVHPRAWPDFYNLIKVKCPYMHIGFSKSGRRMILRKMKCTNNAVDNNDILLDEKMRHEVVISERDFELIKQFEELGRLHERNMLSGYRRQTKR